VPSKAWIQIIIGLVAGAMVGLSALTGDSVDEQGLRWLTSVSGGIVLLLLMFDRWLWRLPGIRWLCEMAGRPVIHGTWYGTLKYEKDQDGKPGSTEIYIAIKQTFSEVRSIRCYFPKTEAESWSLAAALQPNDHRSDLRYIYQQQAPVPNRDTNRPTEGACQLAVSGRPVNELSGSYYAERGGRGTIQAGEYSSKVAGSLGDAQRLRVCPQTGEGARMSL